MAKFSLRAAAWALAWAARNPARYIALSCSRFCASSGSTGEDEADAPPDVVPPVPAVPGVEWPDAPAPAPTPVV